MQNYFYCFNNVIRKQRNEGAIENSLTKKLAKKFIKRFGRKLMSLTRKHRIEKELYSRFVDDITSALKALDPSVRFNK